MDTPDIVMNLPVSVPLSMFFIREGVQVGEWNDVAAVRAQPLLIKAALPLLQLALVLVGNVDIVGVVFHAHPSDSGVVALQEVPVHSLIVLHDTDRHISTVTSTQAKQGPAVSVKATKR